MLADLWYLPLAPGRSALKTVGWYEAKTRGGYGFRSPILAPDEAADIVQSVRAAALGSRRTHRVSDVIRSVSRAALRVADAGDAIGRAAHVCLRDETGWSASMVSATIAGMAETWTEAELSNLVRGELGSADVLEAFHDDPARPGRQRRAAGPPVIGLVQAGNVPGTGITAVIRCLLVRSAVICKLPADEPGLTVHFAQALAEEDASLGSCLTATWWPADEADPLAVEMRKCSGKVVIYGGESAVAAYRRDLPASTELLIYGPRTGVAVLLSDASTHDRRIEAGLAADVCAYEQEGCVSPRLVFVLGSSAREFGARLAHALADVSATHEPPPPSPADAVRLRALRASAELAAYGDADGEVDLFDSGPENFAWTVRCSETPGVGMEDLPRTVFVYHVGSAEQLGKLLEPLRDRIQVIGYAGSLGLPELAELANELGVSRVAPIGSIAWPPADWRHDGRHQLLPLVQWTDLETEV